MYFYQKSKIRHTSNTMNSYSTCLGQRETPDNEDNPNVEFNISLLPIAFTCISINRLSYQPQSIVFFIVTCMINSPIQTIQSGTRNSPVWA